MIFRTFLTCLTLILLSSCASIVHGSKQNVTFTSQPKDAKIFINGIQFGETPNVVSLRRKGRHKGDTSGGKEYIVSVELDGYYPYKIKLQREIDGWFWGNLVLGGPIGFIIDWTTGSIYKLTPNQVMAQMPSATSYIHNKDSNILIAITLEPDPSWEKVGHLEKIWP